MKKRIAVAAALLCLLTAPATAQTGTAVFFEDYDRFAVLTVETVDPAAAGPCYGECDLVALSCNEHSVDISLPNLSRREIGAWLLAEPEPPVPLRPEMLELVVHFDDMAIETLLWDIDYDDFARMWRANTSVLRGEEGEWLRDLGAAGVVGIATPDREYVFPGGAADVENRRLFVEACLRIMGEPPALPPPVVIPTPVSGRL